MKIIFVLIFAFGTAVHAQEGKKLAESCAACHGADGKSVNSFWPNLAGQKKDYIIKQLHDFQSGTRKNVMMEPMVKMLSDKDIEALATYFSGLKS